jgi:hypothetical protein
LAIYSSPIVDASIHILFGADGKLGGTSLRCCHNRRVDDTVHLSLWVAPDVEELCRLSAKNHVFHA